MEGVKGEAMKGLASKKKPLGEFVSARVREGEKKRVQEAAQARGMSESDWVRTVILTALDLDPEVMFLGVQMAAIQAVVAELAKKQGVDVPAVLAKAEAAGQGFIKRRWERFWSGSIAAPVAAVAAAAESTAPVAVAAVAAAGATAPLEFGKPVYLSCQKCREYAASGGPSHDGSPLCKSGSIASGGTRAHCSCDVCY